MATIIRTKRSTTSGAPTILADGELAYSAANYGAVAGGGRLYIGIGAETGGDAASHLVIGGQYFTDKLDHSPGTLTANSALIVDSDSKLDNIKIDNIDINGNTISSTDVDGNIVLDPNGSGLISVSSTRIINAADPINAQDVVTKAYLEGAINLEYFQDDIAGMITGGIQNGISVTYDDTNGEIDFDVNDFTITLGTGPITGSVTVTNLGNATLNTTLANDSVTLGTHTTGSYVESLVAGTGVTLADNSGEGATPTISIGQPVATTDNVTFNDINAHDLIISGDFTVGGTTTTVNAQNLTISDNMIYLNQASLATITNAVGDGTYVVYTVESHNYTIGMSVTITEIDPSSFNVSNAIITNVTETTFTIESSVTDTYISDGLARGKSNANPDLGWAAGRYDGSYAHAGVFRDASDGIFKFFDGYIPEPDEDVFIDTTDESFALAPVASLEFIGPLTGNADTATKWSSAKTITLGGDLTGNVSIDGSANVTLTATIAANSVELGTDTTGNYVATVNGTSGEIASSVTTGESAATILSLINTTVVAGSYGSATQIPTFTVDSKGRLTAASYASISTALSITDGSNSDTVSLSSDTLTFTGGTGLTSTVSDNAVTFNLDNTAVSPATYGSASAVATFTVDQQGRITNALNTNISITSGAITDFNEAAQDAIGIAISNGTQTNATVTYQDISNSIDFSVATATTSVKGVASFSSTNFNVSSGVVTVVDLDGGSY